MSHRIAVALLLLLSLVPHGSAHAAASDASDGRPPKVLVVLDVSGSMAQPAGSGLTRLQAARRALAELVHTLPPDSRVGLRVYGSEYAGRNRRVACQDTRRLVPIGPLRPGRLLSAAAQLRPTGDTPIALALTKGAADLRASRGGGKPVIVLISDGEDNCSAPGNPPCEVAQALQRGGFAVRIETVGVALGGRSRATGQLACIARRTSGRYYDAGDSDALSAALERISSDTLGGLGAGEPVARVASRAAAPLVEPGAYRLALRPGQVAWFRFEAAARQLPQVLATVEGLPTLRVPFDERRCPAWSVRLYNPFGEGGTFPPYGGSARFDGVGVGTVGASTTDQLDPYSTGIDYPGTWRIQLSLAADTLDTCSEALPPTHAFPVRFSLQLHEAGDDGPLAPSTGPSQDPSAGARLPNGDDPDLTAKYGDPARPPGAPGWVAPLLSVVCALCAGALGSWLYRVRRRRRRGW